MSRAAGHVETTPLPLAARRHPLVPRVAAGLARTGLDLQASRLVVAISGGADSSALLLALAVLARRDGDPARRLLAVHVHHHLRGADADGDAAAAAGLAARCGVPFRRADVHPADHSGNGAAVARRLRYAALAEAARSVGATAIATAHHAEDQLETMLLALARGTGAGGLRGIARRRRLEGDLHLLRPMLEATRADARELCRAAGVTWREDPTNADATTARGRLRRDVLPVLAALHPDAARRAAATAESLREILARTAATEPDDDAVPATAWPRAALRDAPVTIAGDRLRRAALALRPDLGDRIGRRLVDPVVAAIRDAQRHPRRYDWPGGLRLTLTATEVRLDVAPEGDRIE